MWIRIGETDQIRKADQMSEAPERIDEAATQASKNMAIWISDYGDAEANRLWDEYNDAIQAWARKNIKARTTIDAQDKLIEAGKRLSFAAQTSGGTAGRDDDLVKAIDDFSEALAALQENTHD